MSEGRRSNRLASSTSPYLLQHAGNPVDWYPWGEEALARARAEDRPILLSVGYAACHWCHVMERESFEDEDIARRMNEHFVCIKVDREERPDVDDVYMAATVALTGSGGWPMTVFCAPDGRPFFAGTYFPPRAKYGRPGFAELLDRIAEAWSKDRDALLVQADELTRHLRQNAEPSRPAAVPVEAVELAVRQLERTFDATWGGFGNAPKFPPAQSLRLLLRHHARTGAARSLEMATVTLDRMHRGGMYDHLAGGFARYSTDARWQVPHFEKMLYDNALLARAYLEAFQITGAPALRRVVEGTLGWVLDEMQLDHGGFASATDADSEGVEGKYFVFTPEEIAEALGDDGVAADRFCAAYDVRPEGNWEGHNVLWMPRPLAVVARELGLAPDALEGELASSREKVLAFRRTRVPPARDDKALAAWNGLAIGAMAEAARVLGDERLLGGAVRAARFVVETLTRPDGGLFRTHRAGTSQLAAYLEDYAFVADALVDLYEATGDDAWLAHAERLARRMVSDFGDEENGAFFQTAHDHETLLVRGREGTDGAIPAANAVAARVLARLATHLGDAALRARAGRAIAAHGAGMRRVPRAFATALLVVEDLVEPPIEIAVVGPPADEATRVLDRVVAGLYLPNRAIARLDPSPATAPATRPLLEGKVPVDGRPAAYVCRDFACSAPSTTAEELRSTVEQAIAAARSARERAVRPPLRPGRATAEGTRASTTSLPDGAVVTAGELALSRVVIAPRPTTRDLVAVLRAGLRAGARAILVEGETARRVGAALEALAGDADLPPREGLVLLARVEPGEGPGLAGMTEAIADLLEVEAVDGVVAAAAPTAEEDAALVALRAAGRLGALGVVHPGGGADAHAPLRAIALRATDGAGIAATGHGLALGALDASRRGRRVRLDAAAPPAGAPAFEDARADLAALEQEFRATIATQLQAPPGSDLDPGALLAFAEPLAPLPAEMATLDEVDAFVAEALEPALGAATSALDDLPPPLGERWRSLRARYLPALTATLTALRARVGARARADAEAVLRDLAPHLPAGLQGEHPVARALALALATPGVDVVVADVADEADAASIAIALAAPRFDVAPGRAAIAD